MNRAGTPTMTTRFLVAAATLTGYLGTIYAANWAISTYGTIPVGFGLIAPAGVLFAGLAFTLRDLAQETAGRTGVLAAIAAGALLSATFGPWRLALASGVAFGLSELADFAVYQPLRTRRWLLAVTASNTVGLAVDSALFLWLAFGSLAYLPGQLLGKAWMTALAVSALTLARRLRSRRVVPAGVDR